jgi:hypothetical protein
MPKKEKDAKKESVKRKKAKKTLVTTRLEQDIVFGLLHMRPELCQNVEKLELPIGELVERKRKERKEPMNRSR